MRIALQLAAALLLTAAAARAQVSSPDKLTAPSPIAPGHHRAQATDNLQWLWPFTKPEPIGDAAELRVDARFQSLLAREFTQQQAMWGDDVNHRPALAKVIPLFVTKYGAVAGYNNRYVLVDGCVPSFCSAAGLLWIDTRQPSAAKPESLMVFAATNWIAEGSAANEQGAAYELWLFANQNVDPNALPFALTTSIADWQARLAAAHRLVPHITHALLVEPNGSPYALDPTLVGTNTLAPQPDTVTPEPSEN